MVLLTGIKVVHAESQTEEPESLYNRLGGLAPIAVVVNDFIDVMVVDELLNANPAIDAARKAVPASYLKYHVTAMVCQATGGPCQYQGRTMKASHAHLNISEKEWDQMAVLLKGVFDKYEIPDKEQQELMDIAGSTQSDIVSKK
ncbi:group 1 truncated hemoglobin [uncultured Photobacterium sp.]|uniref:group I truncated hemoglobin n=1 Tax=uncultured Photobacterium sp. TaxID=173973 RepID=UPI00260E1C97|nr:group 1 truncated hemoglobin [uncultured Photobacterium sp.]